jgi:hypothetical protein
MDDAIRLPSAAVAPRLALEMLWRQSAIFVVGALMRSTQTFEGLVSRTCAFSVLMLLSRGRRRLSPRSFLRWASSIKPCA